MPSLTDAPFSSSPCSSVRHVAPRYAIVLHEYAPAVHLPSRWADDGWIVSAGHSVLLLRHSQQNHCLHVVALLLHSVVQSSFCNGSLATLQAGPLQAGPTGRTISALIAATRNMRSFIRKDPSSIAGKHALPIGRQGGERRSGRQSANKRRRASHTPFPLLLAQDKRITDAMALTACDLP